LTRLEQALPRLEAQEGRLEALQSRLTTIAARFEALEAGWQQHLPAFLNAVASVRAFGHELAHAKHDLSQVKTELEAELEARIAQPEASIARLGTEDETIWGAISKANTEIERLWQRVEFVRSETLYELKYGSANKARGNAVQARVLLPEKVEAARRSGSIRLNLGCGHLPLDGYINIDMRELPGVDVVADVAALPFEEGSVAAIHSSHMLEHFPQELLVRSLLPYWKSLLRDKGGFSAVVPDGKAMLKATADGSMPFEDFRRVLFGAQDYDGDFHYNLMTPESLSALLLDAGFESVQVPVQGRRNDICLEFEVTARRGPGSP
jgi:hypothetical protein